MSDSDYERLSMPNTTSILYNFSRALNMSEDPRDIEVRDFNFWGYPSDAFAIHFLRKSPGFVFTLQAITFSMIICFGIMSAFLAYMTFFQQ
jgi:hypothetical protein